MIKFTIPAVPVAQPRQRSAMIAGKVRNYTPATHPVNAFKATARLAWANSDYDGEPLPYAFAVRLTFVFPRPGRLIWKSRPMPRAGHTRKPDADNLAKAVLDALNGVVWPDDSQVCRLTVEKVYAAGGEQPHVEVRIGDTCEDLEATD